MAFKAFSLEQHVPVPERGAGYHKRSIVQHFWGILEHLHIAVVTQAPHKVSLILCSAGQAGAASRSVHLAWEVPRPQSNVLETPPQRFSTLLTPQSLSFPMVSPNVERSYFARHLFRYLLPLKHRQWSVPIPSMPLY